MFGQTCGDCRLLFSCRRAMGEANARSSLRPLVIERVSFAIARVPIAPRDGVRLCRSMSELRAERMIMRQDWYIEDTAQIKRCDPAPATNCNRT
jgi:hypothetical protein